MKIIVDTCVWSAALRRAATSPAAEELRRLIEQGAVQLIGPIRQEILSGIRDRRRYDQLKDVLRSYPDLALETADYEAAAGLFNDCRRKGVQGSNTDFLICAVAARRAMPIFTTDLDFERFALHLPLRLHRPPAVQH